ncbi:MAG: hypothetical protein MHM6MM_006504, partial [Cercozoa sp. M6MM]
LRHAQMGMRPCGSVSSPRRCFLDIHDSGVQLFHVHSKHDLGQYCRLNHKAVFGNLFLSELSVSRAQDTVQGVMFGTGPVDDLAICCDDISHSVVPLDSGAGQVSL